MIILRMRRTSFAGFWRTLFSPARFFAIVALSFFGLLILRGVAPADQTSNWSEDPGPRYLSPVDLKLSRDGARLYVVCEDSDKVLMVDTRMRRVIEQVQVGRRPKGLALSPNGKKLYVSNELDNSVTEIDAGTFQVQRTFGAGWGPVGLTTDGAGKFLYAANTLGDDVSVIDLATGREIKRLAASRFPEYVDLSKDGQWVYVTNLLPRVGEYDEPPVSELTVIDTQRQTIAKRIDLPGVVQVRHITELSGGGDLIVPFMRPHNLVPLVQLKQAWYLTHGIAVVRPPASRADGGGTWRVTEVSLDDIDRSFADGFGAASTPDGRLALVTASGADVVSIIDSRKLNRLIERAPASDPEALADRLDSANQFVLGRAATGRNPTAIEVAPDGRLAYIADRMDDAVTVLDLKQLKAESTIDLGGPREVTQLRHGERLFFDARYCDRDELACATCHPHEGIEDSLLWSMETPELGRDNVENRTLLGIDGTSPFKWNGMNPNLETQDGPRTAMYVFRSQGFSQTEVEDLASYLLSLRLPPNPRLATQGGLTESEERGRAIFFRAQTNGGKLIPMGDRCYFCHPPASHYTARVRMNVGTSTKYDNIKAFDIPQIEGVYMRAPYLHNGEAQSLEDIWTKFNPDDQHGITSDMNKAQLNDLIEYLKTL